MCFNTDIMHVLLIKAQYDVMHVLLMKGPIMLTFLLEMQRNVIYANSSVLMTCFCILISARLFVLDVVLPHPLEMMLGNVLTSCSFAHKGVVANHNDCASSVR